LSIYPFDFDLTMAVLLANGDGTVYHRYGGRTKLSPMSMNGLVDLMEKGIETHRAYQKNPVPPLEKEPLHLAKLINEDLRGTMKPVNGCFHCHYAREAEQIVSLRAGDWTPDKFWIFPEPKRLGLVMDQKRQYRVSEVITESATAKAGVMPDDVLLTLEGKRILTKYDIQWILNQADPRATSLAFSLQRNGQTIFGNLTLEDGWKVGDPDDYRWRVQNPFTAHMIKFLPAPGFIGERLEAGELKELGMTEDRFALYISNLNHGPFQAGIRLGDIVLSAGGRSDFAGNRDFYAWCESLRRAGRDIRMKIRREGQEMDMMISLSYLNYTRVERAPQVEIGFIPQQLPENEGIRVGNVLDDCAAEKAGVTIGDRIVSVSGEEVARVESFINLVDQKSPGESLTMKVIRRGKLLEITYVLAQKALSSQ